MTTCKRAREAEATEVTTYTLNPQTPAQRFDAARGRARANLGDTMCGLIRVADLGGRILKWPKSDEKLRSAKT